MFPLSNAALAVGNNIPPATLVGVTSFNSAGSAAFVFPVGTQAGDLAIISTASDSSAVPIVTGPGGWTKDTIVWNVYGYRSSIFYKVLVSGDLAGGSVSDQGSGISVAVYRGATVVSIKSRNTGEWTDKLTFPGFTPSSLSKGFVTVGNDRNAGSLPTAPAGFTRRVAFSQSYWAHALADNLRPANYAAGTPIVWADWIDGLPNMGWLLELT